MSRNEEQENNGMKNLMELCKNIQRQPTAEVLDAESCSVFTKDRKATNPMLAWHYTTGEKFRHIVDSGALLPTAKYIAKGEQPILWFSLEQFWEPTAQKAVLRNGEVIPLNMEGTFRLGGGLVRFGVSPQRLIPWPRIAKLANIPSIIRRSLEEVGREQRAVPERWCGLVNQPLPVSEVEAIEVFEDEKWVRIPLPQPDFAPDCAFF